MQALINSFLLVFASEMGDKTQLLALLLASRYKKPWTILLGVLIATVLNHALATWAGAWVSTLVTHQTLIYILSGIFFVFGLWILIPDKEEEFKERGHFGALVTTVIAFFIAEMGDKTQLATIALGARYQDVVMVTIGTTIGMMGSNSLAIFLGEKLLRKVPMKWVRLFSCILFIAFGIGILIKG